MTEETAIAKKDGSALAIARVDGVSIGDLLGENFGGDPISPFDLGRVRIPSGGGTHWLVPDIEEEDGRPEKEVSGVVINQRTTRVYWEKGLDDEGGERGPPQCRSLNGRSGSGDYGDGKDTGHDCRTCPMNEWGSGKGEGKACKEQKELYVLQPDQTLPDLFVLPPSSLGAWKKFLLGAVKKGIGINSVVIGLGLKKVTSGGGIDYAQATFKVKERLSDADAVAAKEYAKSFGDVVSGFDVADTSG